MLVGTTFANLKGYPTIFLERSGFGSIFVNCGVLKIGWKAYFPKRLGVSS
jgi:hypothetical protein